MSYRFHWRENSFWGPSGLVQGQSSWLFLRFSESRNTNRWMQAIRKMGLEIWKLKTKNKAGTWNACACSFFESYFWLHPRTLTILCLTISLMALRAGPRYFRGSNSPGFSTKIRRISAVIARRRSVSILILQTPYFAASRSMCSGTPCAPGMFPPYWLHQATNSGSTVEAPWSTRG